MGINFLCHGITIINYNSIIGILHIEYRITESLNIELFHPRSNMYIYISFTLKCIPVVVDGVKGKRSPFNYIESMELSLRSSYIDKMHKRFFVLSISNSNLSVTIGVYLLIASK